MAIKATIFYKLLASIFSEKWETNYAVVMEWVRCCLSFSLLNSAIGCLPASKVLKGQLPSLIRNSTK